VTKELRRLSIVMLVMFLALFGSTSWIQVVQAEALAEHPRNTRALYDSYEVQRGSIIVDGAAIATSVATTDVYSFQRVYADADMWAPVTGYINAALGSSTGIEQAMNPELSGTDGSQFLSRIERIVSGQPPRGSNVLLSLDTAAQSAAHEGLEGLEGAVLAIEPSTGRILAMATSPSYDTNLLATHNTTDAIAAYDALDADPGDPLSNRAIAGSLNPPGSTFKLITAATAFASGEWTPESTLPNPAVYQLPQSSSTVQNAWGGTCGPGEVVTIAEALRLSCNIPFAELAVQLGDQALREMSDLFGFNRPFETPLLSTQSVYPRALDDAQTALTGFGQGQVIATPLQMAMVSAGIANEGVVMNPRMVDRVIGPDLAVQQTFDDTEFGRALDADIARELGTLMVRNVNDGAASGARIEGVDVAGKTGTAENGDREPYTLWFTGFAPADNPQVAVAVVVENGGGQGQSGSGDTIAAPIAKKVMEAVLNR
jgi:peptidoglycan glycosyltransferase